MLFNPLIYLKKYAPYREHIPVNNCSFNTVLYTGQEALCSLTMPFIARAGDHLTVFKVTIKETAGERVA